MNNPGWWEDYECGCVSKTVKRKKDLLGYCPVHGETRRQVWPDKFPSSFGESYEKHKEEKDG